MPSVQTKLANMINPQVMADMISAQLPKLIKVAPIATIDTSLQGQPGNTLTFPKYAFIGEANDVAEGVAMDLELLSATSTTVTVKKAGKGVEITDEAVLSGYGDPLGEAQKQLGMAIASKVDTDCMTALNTGTVTYDGSAAIISYNGIVDAIDKFNEEDYEPKVLFIHPNQLTQIRKDANFLSLDKYPVPVIMNGVIGSIAGCQVVVSKRVAESTPVGSFLNPIVKAGALKIVMKRNVQVEADRDIVKKTNVLTADEHYVAYLYDNSKVVVAKFKKA